MIIAVKLNRAAVKKEPLPLPKKSASPYSTPSLAPEIAKYEHLPPDLDLLHLCSNTLKVVKTSVFKTALSQKANANVKRNNRPRKRFSQQQQKIYCYYTCCKSIFT